MDVAAVDIDPGLRVEVKGLLARLAGADGTEALSEHKMIRAGGGLDIRDLALCTDDGNVVGYAQAAWHAGSDRLGHWAIEVAVDEKHRDAATVASLVERIRGELGAEDVVFWSRAPYTATIGDEPGWHPGRVLYEMRRNLPGPDFGREVSGMEVTTFRVGLDEERWLRLNGDMFAGHPESGSMTRQDLEMRMGLPWFEPAGFFLGRVDGELVACCWTKLHGDGVGEIYIIGVDPRWEGRGFGRTMLGIGLRHLARVHRVSEAMLYVDEANRRAVELYERFGFTVTNSSTAYEYVPT